MFLEFSMSGAEFQVSYKYGGLGSAFLYYVVVCVLAVIII
jgi:hypothetical protein